MLSNETMVEMEGRSELNGTIDSIVALLDDSLESGQSNQKRLATVLAKEFVSTNSSLNGVSRVKLIVSRVKELYSKDDWKLRKTVISMVSRVLTLSGTIVAIEWVQGNFGKYPIQSTYRALVSKYDSSGKRKVVKGNDEKLLGMFRNSSKKYGTENVILAYNRFMSLTGDVKDDESDVIASIDPFEGMETR